jgi:prepilin-type N-terminal cleavage/methylation domain-containing protein
MKKRHERRGGFTLLELMLVVTILAIIMAIAIPGIQNARITANEASAISTLRTVTTVNVQYRLRFGRYPASLNNLFAEGYIDSSVANPTKAGYTFTYVGNPQTFTFNGNPMNPGQSGFRYFYVDAVGVIRFNASAPATAADPPLGQ